MPIVGQDDKFYLTDTGGRIAKSGLSETKRSKFDSEISAALAPQATPVPMAPAQAPLVQTIPAAGTGNPFESPAGNISSLSQLNLGAPAPGQASLGGSPAMPAMPSSSGMPEPMQPKGAGQGANELLAKGLQDYEQGVSQQQMGIQKMANAQMQEAKAVNEESLRLQSDLDKLEAQRLQIQQRRQEAVATAEQNLSTSLQEYDNAKIDPDRYFAGNSGKRLLAGLAIAFGEIGRSMTGGQSNTALNIINNAIDADIKAQSENRQAIGQRIAAQRQIAQDLRSRFKDEEDAVLAQKIISTEMAQRKIAEIGRRYGTIEAQGKADSLIGQLEQQKGQYMTTLFGKAAANAEKVTPAGLTSDQVKIVSDLAGSYEKNDGINSFNKIDLAFKKMEKLSEIAQKNPNAAQAIITTFNRVLDENSVVREAEVNLTMQAGSVVDRFRQQAEKVATGTMTPAQVKNLVEAAQQLRDAALEGKQKVDQRFTERANAFGVPSNLVVAPSPVSAGTVRNELSSFTPQGQQEKPKTKTANVMPGR